jgi:putative hydrolase
MLKIDLHIHSIHSGHAYGTIYDIIKEAKKKKMKMIAITDHGPSVRGGPVDFHFSMGKRAPKKEGNLKILWGCEANVINENGEIDLRQKDIDVIDVLLVGMHDATPYNGGSEEKNTKSILNCFEKYPIHIFVHPTCFFHTYNLEKVCEAACKNNVLLELNIETLRRIEREDKRDSLERLKKMIDIVKKNQKKVIVNSDAHFLHEIGDDSLLKKFKPIIGLNDEMIINNYPKELEEFLKSK